MSIVDGDASVRQALLLLLTTRPGERVMRPEYGCNLQTLAFSPNDDTTAGLAMHYVTQAIERWEPRVEIVRLNALRGAERDDLLEIVLDYRLVTRTRVERLVVPVSLAGRDS
jgi:phage baseplate assembly protein W